MLRLWIAACLLFAAPAAWAQSPQTECPGHFAQGAQPQFTGAVPAGALRGLCYRAYAVLHSGTTRTPVWSAEMMTAASVKMAQAMPRHGDFFTEKRLPADEAAKPDDYLCDQYDRGHMTPVGDMGVEADEQDTFSMANMVPQWPNLNEGLWMRMERLVQDVASANETIYVVTGPLYGTNPAWVHGRVAIPAATWKAIYAPGKHAAAAYWATNDNVPGYRIISIAELTQRTGIDPFPGASAAEKAALLDLPGIEPKFLRTSPTTRSCAGPADGEGVTAARRARSKPKAVTTP